MPLKGTLENFMGTFLSDTARARLREGGEGIVRNHFPKFSGSRDDEATFNRLVMAMDDGDRKALVEIWIPLLRPNSSRLRDMILNIHAMAQMKLPSGVDAKTFTALQLLELRHEAEEQALKVLVYLAELPAETGTLAEIQTRVDEGRDRKTRAAVSLKLMKARESDYLGERLKNLVEFDNAADTAALVAEETTLREQLADIRAGRGPATPRPPLTWRQRLSFFSLTGRR